VVCESQVFNAVLEWVKYDPNSRRNLLNDLIKNVRCHLIKPEFISRQLENCEIIRSTCCDYLTKVLEDLKAFIPIESKSRQLDLPQVIYVTDYIYNKPEEKSLKSAKFYLSETDVSFRLPKLCIPRRSRCAVINGFIYVLDVYNGGMDRYDPISNEWKKCEGLDTERSHGVFPEMVNIQNELYYVEGSGKRRLMKYDPIADEWTQRASLNKNHFNFGCTVFNRMLYVVGGGIFWARVLKYVYKYDPISNQWTSVTPMLTRRSKPAVVTLGNYIYAIGGSNRKGNLCTVERYDVLNDKWEFVASMKYKREFPQAVVFNKKIYVFGGYDGYQCNKVVECYDEETNKWKEVARSQVYSDQPIVSYEPCVPDICKNFPF